MECWLQRLLLIVKLTYILIKMRKKIIKRALTNNYQIPYQITTLYSEQPQSLNTPLKSVLTTLKMPSIVQNIHRLKQTAIEAACGVLTNNQVGKAQNIFVMNKNIGLGSNASTVKEMKWIDDQYQRNQSYQCYINAQIVQASSPLSLFEESVSFPFLIAQVRRFNRISVRYLDENGNSKNEVMEGFKACAFQHAWDFSIGRHLLDWRLHQGNLQIQQQVGQKLPKTSSVVQQYNKQLKSILWKYPNLCYMPQKIEQNEISWLYSRGSSQNISIEQDYITRIHKHYRKQMLLMLERLEHQVQ